MSEFVNTISLLGDDAVIDSIIERTIQEFRDNIVTSVGTSAFSSCVDLTVVDLPSIASIAGSAFNGCASLVQLILRKDDAVVTLASTNALTSTPIASGTGYIYVPAALIDSYKAASNWSTYADQFRALEDYTVDGTIMGDLDESKI